VEDKSDTKNRSVLFEFVLFRGCYATSLLREYMKVPPEDFESLKSFTSNDASDDKVLSQM